MKNKLDNNEEVFDELDLEMEDLEQVEVDLEEFLNSLERLECNVEYTIRNKFGNTYYVNYDFKEDNGRYRIFYLEQHYTKFWRGNIHASEYLKLKAKCLNKIHSDINVELEIEDDCHPTLVMNTLCNEEEVKSRIKSLEDTCNDFDKKFNELESKVKDLIDNTEF